MQNQSKVLDPACKQEEASPSDLQAGPRWLLGKRLNSTQMTRVVVLYKPR